MLVNPGFSNLYLYDPGGATTFFGGNAGGGAQATFFTTPTSFSNEVRLDGGARVVGYSGRFQADRTFEINSGTGGADLSLLAIRPVADVAGAFTVKTARGSGILDIATSAGGNINVLNGVSLHGYSDNLHELAWRLDGASGKLTLCADGVQRIALSPADGTITTSRGGALFVGATQVVSGRKTGWGVASGHLSRAAYVAYGGQTPGAVYSREAAQTTNDALVTLSRTVAALITDLTAHGLIGE